MVRHAHLADLLIRSRESTGLVDQLFEGLDRTQLAWKPDPSRWNVVECIGHLANTGQVYLPAVRAALERVKGEGRASDEPFRFTWFGKWFVGMSGPVVRRRLSTPGVFAPAPVTTDITVRDGFADVQREIERLVEDADGWLLNGRRFRSPVTPLIRLTLGEGLTLLVWHTQRHVAQAQELTRHPGFPSA